MNNNKIQAIIKEALIRFQQPDYKRGGVSLAPQMYDAVSKHAADKICATDASTDGAGGRLQVRVSEILDMAKRKREINSKSLTDIDFLDEAGNIIQVDKKIIDDFRLVGLNNTDFITSGFYLKGWTFEKDLKI